jgi:hypothetical protein
MCFCFTKIVHVDYDGYISFATTSVSVWGDEVAAGSGWFELVADRVTIDVKGVGIIAVSIVK